MDKCNDGPMRPQAYDPNDAVDGVLDVTADEIARLLDGAGIDVERLGFTVEQTGGNCATMFIGPKVWVSADESMHGVAGEYWSVAIGVGVFDWDYEGGSTFSYEEMVVCPDWDDVGFRMVANAAELVDAVRGFVTAGYLRRQGRQA